MILSVPRLEKARKQYFLMEDIRATLESIYDTYRSPDPGRQAGAKYSRTDKTAQAVNEIDELETLYKGVLTKFSDYLLFVMDRVSDPVIQSLIVLYYFGGKSWRDTNVYRAKLRVYEYIETHYEELNANEY